MLGGAKVTPKARANAEELIRQAQAAVSQKRARSSA
jgi:hypothetical protein